MVTNGAAWTFLFPVAAAARAAFRRDLPTLREYGDKWLENRRTRGRELRPTTRQQYRMILDTYIYPTFGNEPLAGLQPAAHHLHVRSLGAATAADPVQPRAHPRCRQCEARPQGPARLAAGVGDHRRGAPDRYQLTALLPAGAPCASASWPSSVAATSTRAPTESRSPVLSCAPTASSSSTRRSRTLVCAMSRSPARDPGGEGASEEPHPEGARTRCCSTGSRAR